MRFDIITAEMCSHSSLLAAVALALATPLPLSAAGPVVRTVAEALALTAETCPEPRPFDFTGTALSRGTRIWSFADDTAACPISNRQKGQSNHRRGDYVRVRGEMVVAPDEVPAFYADPPEILRRGTPPPPVDASVADILAGRFNYRFVRVRGAVVSAMKDEVDARFCWARLRTEDGELFLPMSGRWNDIERLWKLVDAEIEVSGHAQPSLGWRHNLPPHLVVDDDSSIHIRQPPPKDPFSAPPFDNTITPHRRRIQGEVAAVGKNRFFLRTKTGRIIPMYTSTHTRLPRTGDLVTAAAFAANDPYRLKMLEALVRVDGHSRAKTVAASPLDIDTLFSDANGNERINIHFDCKFVRIRGKVLRPEKLDAAAIGELQLTDGRRSVSVEISSLHGELGSVPENGSDVEVSGLCLAEFEQQATSTMLPRFRQFSLIPCTAADIRVLSGPPLWTPRRLLVVIGALLAVLAFIAAWNRALRRAVERRGRELREAERGKDEAELRIDERTRLAVELHDSLSQTLTGAFFQVEAAACALKADPHSVDRCLNSAMSTIQSCREELKNCLWDLRNNALDETNAESAVRRVVGPHLGKASLSLHVALPRSEISDNTFHAILRILRELVSNAVRHGHAGNIDMSAGVDNGVIHLVVSDDGRGFDPKSRPGTEEGHFGLQGICDRLKGMNGTMKVVSAPGAGTRVEITAEL